MTETKSKGTVRGKTAAAPAAKATAGKKRAANSGEASEKREQTRKKAATKPAKKPANKPAKAAKTTKPTTPRRGVGRPSKFGTIDLEKVQVLATRGWTDEDMAAFFNIGLATWYRWKDEHPEFREALIDWKIEADSRVERSLYERATGYSHPDTHVSNYQGDVTLTPITKHYPPDSTAMIFWLKNRQPARWRDKRDVALGAEEGSPFENFLNAISGEGNTLKPSADSENSENSETGD